MRVLVLMLVAISIAGCDGDCSVSEASGLLAPFGGGCNAGATIDGDNIDFSILVGLGDHDENLYKDLEFVLVGPAYVGRRQTAEVVVSHSGQRVDDPLAHGSVDLIIDGADYTKSYDQHFNINIVNLEVRDDITSQIGVFKGSVSVISTTVTP